MTDTQQIWLNLVSGKYPSLTEDQALAMSMKAASEYYLGGDPTMVELFEQYLVMKTLQGV